MRQRAAAAGQKQGGDQVLLGGVAAELAYSLYQRQARVAVLGLGYAGLPMAVELAKAGFHVTGVDVNPERVGQVSNGRSPVSNVADADIAAKIGDGHLRAATGFEVLEDADAVLICVPTPLTADQRPNLDYVRAAARSIAAHLHPGMLVVLQSTCSPGTTRQVLQPALAAVGGMDLGEDYFVAFAPERIDPGNGRFTVRNTPKLVGGMTPESTELASLLFTPIVERVLKLSCPEVAEMAKLIENTFRFINISFVNEMTVLCDRLGVDIWEVIDAAATKPFAFMPHYPGPGVGGECIPVVPFFLQAAARDCGVEAELIEAAGRVNDEMPHFVVEKLERLVEERGGSLTESRGLLIGMAYKEDSGDVRESPALRVLDLLQQRGAAVSYYDPYVPQVVCGGNTEKSLTSEELDERDFDYAILLTAHRGIDYDRIAGRAGLILDTRNRFPSRQGTEVVKV